MRDWRVVAIGLFGLTLAAGGGTAQQLRSDGRADRSASSGTRDPDDWFRSMAKGKDVIQRSEIDPGMQWFFDRVAAKLKITDGKMTQQQFREFINQTKGGDAGKAAAAPAAAEPAPAAAEPAPAAAWSRGRRGGGADWNDPEAMARMADDSFRSHDKNGDGVLDYNEMPEALRADLETWDRDGNGTIDREEYRAYFTARLQQKMVEREENGLSVPGRNNGGDSAPAGGKAVRPVVYRTSNLPRELPDWFRRYDKNGDAQVSLKEWREGGGSLEEFRRIDRNNDGFLTVEEVLRHQGNGAPNGKGRDVQIVRNDDGDPGTAVALDSRTNGGDRRGWRPPTGGDRGNGADRRGFRPNGGADRGDRGNRPRPPAPRPAASGE
jgi:Ca2+-binding EF-hand superfamily protein